MRTTIVLLMMIVANMMIAAAAAVVDAAAVGVIICRPVPNIDLRSGDGQRVTLGTGIVQWAPVEDLVHGSGHLSLTCCWC